MRPFAGVNELVFLQQKLVRKRLCTIVVVTHPWFVLACKPGFRKDYFLNNPTISLRFTA